MKINEILIICSLILTPNYCWGFTNNHLMDSSKILNNQGIEYFIAGDYEYAEMLFIKSIKLSEEISPQNHINIANSYNNLGVLYKNKWQYSSALEYLNKAKDIYETHSENTTYLANVLSNIGNVHHQKGDYMHAEYYYNKSLDYLEKNNSSLALQRKAEVLNRYALLEIEKKDYYSAIKLILKGISEYSKAENNSDVTMHNLLTTASEAYSLNNNQDSSLYYIQLSINLIEKNIHFSEHLKAVTYRKLSEYYLKNKQLKNALESIITTETIYRSSSIDSVFYFEIIKLYAKYYELKEEFRIATHYYNKSNQILLHKNSSTQKEYASTIKAIDLLKDKSNCLIKWYYSNNNRIHLIDALLDLKTASELINKARTGYLSIESKLLLAENEGSIYEAGLLCSHTMYELTQETKYIEQAFFFAEKGKSAILLDALNEEKAKTFAGIPDSLLEKEQKLKIELAFYKEKIYKEGLKTQSDSLKILIWKNYLFKYSQKNEQLKQLFEKQYPNYYSFKYHNISISTHEVQGKLSAKSTLIEYSISDSILYTFVITSNKLLLYKTPINNKFFANINSFLNLFREFDYIKQDSNIFRNYEDVAYKIYNSLWGFISPELLSKKLIIIPDGILSYIPFEALVCTANNAHLSSFSELDYLLYKHQIAYSYSASLFAENLNQSKRKIWNKTLAIAPEYNYNPTNKKDEQSTIINTYRNNLRPLPFALDEVRIITNVTNGELLIGKKATEELFIKKSADYDILHLAMHTLIDDNNPLYSKLVFYNKSYQLDEGLLNTSEIFSLKLKAKMVVLSACSSGDGDFKRGEGVMSLSRGFFYSGCHSLLITLWKVEDESGLVLMKSFYKYLLKGYSKSDALRKAKIEYIQSALEQNKHPFFWSSYIIIGNPSPLYVPKWLLIATAIFILFIIVYLKKKITRKKKLPKPTLFFDI